MALTTPISGIIYPELTDVPNNQTAWANMAGAIDTQMVPRFASTAARDAAITSPVEGQMCFISDTAIEKFQVRQGGAWRNLSFTSTIVKPSDESRTSTTTLSADGHLLFAGKANTNYYVTGLLFYEGNTAADIAFSVTVPAATTFQFASSHQGGPAAGGSGNISPYASSLTGASGAHGAGVLASPNILSAKLQGFFRVGATAGNITLVWAQIVSSAIPTVMKAGSYITYQPLP